MTTTKKAMEMETRRQSVFMQMHNGTRTGEGSFNVALKEIFYLADQSNRQKLVAAFPDFFGDEVPEFGIIKHGSVGESESRHQVHDGKMDELKSAFETLLDAEQWHIKHGCPAFDEDNLEDGYFLWTHLPFRHMCLSRIMPERSLPSDNPCDQLALLLNKLRERIFPELSGLSAKLNPQTNKVHFCISGEISTDDVQATLECYHSDATQVNENMKSSPKKQCSSHQQIPQEALRVQVRSFRALLDEIESRYLSGGRYLSFRNTLPAEDIDRPSLSQVLQFQRSALSDYLRTHTNFLSADDERRYNNL